MVSVTNRQQAPSQSKGSEMDLWNRCQLYVSPLRVHGHSESHDLLEHPLSLRTATKTTL